MTNYDRKNTAKIFDESPSISNSFQEMIGDIAFEHLSLNEKDVLLDIGTGTGKYAIKAAATCHHVIGIDISRKSLDIARKNSKHLTNVSFVYGAFEEPSAEIQLEKYGIQMSRVGRNMNEIASNKEVGKTYRTTHLKVRLGACPRIKTKSYQRAFCPRKSWFFLGEHTVS